MQTAKDESFKKTIAILIAVVTALAAVIAFLQSDAGARDDAANRDTKNYALEALGRQVSGDARVNYDYNTAYQAWYELDLLAASAANRGDEAAADRYATLRDEMLKLSPLLSAEYFDAISGEADIARYEAEVYLVDITTLTENFAAAATVKDGWDAKSNTYIVHLTLLAVALFLFGLSTTIAGPLTRWIFSGAGLILTVVAVGWAATVLLTPVPDLRAREGAIDAYARGVGLAYQSRWDEAIAEFDAALQAAPNYANAYVERAQAHAGRGDYAAAAADYEQARANGNTTANVAGELAWAYYLLGRFDDATAMNRTALSAGSADLWIQFDLALSLLSSGQVDAARAEYTTGMNNAAQQVAEAKAAGAEPPSDVWWSLDDAAAGLDDLVYLVDTGEGLPARETIASPGVVREAALALLTELKSLAAALEYTGQPPAGAGALTASISPFEFGEPIYDDEGNVVDYDYADTVAYGSQEVSVLFDYAGMVDGQSVLFKVYINGEEDPSWRLDVPWDLGPDGSAEKPLSLAYSDNFVLAPGEYTVELYVDYQLAQRGVFEVLEE